MEVIDSRRMFGSKLKAFRVKFDNGEVAEYSSDQLKLAPDFGPEHGAVDDEYEKTLDPDYDKADEDEDAYERRLGLEEALNPEVQRTVNNLIKAMAKKYGYEEKDAVFAIQAALKQREFDNK